VLRRELIFLKGGLEYAKKYFNFLAVQLLLKNGHYAPKLKIHD
jgi:hypothetical protein